MRYLVTGAAGFIGSRVTDKLLQAEHSVVGLDNLNDSYDVRMKEYRLGKLLSREGFKFIKMDISYRDQVAQLDAEGTFDAVINLAARAGVRQAVENPWVYLETNTMGTLNLLELCHRLQVPKFLLASTSSIYGANAPIPTSETASSDQPLQPYAASKKGAEVLAYTYHHLYGIDVSVVRYFTVYGPAGRPDMVMFRLAKWITEGETVHLNGTGAQSRGFTYLDDIARGTILATKPVGYEIINLGGHEAITMIDLIGMMEEMIGRKAHIEYHPFHRADLQANLADVHKAKELLGWKPEVDLKQGVRRLVDWYMQERSWACKIATP
jgi:nucleoside-diphosphate-sugar epimerase